MIRVNCAAIPAALIERELFGHERGAFTDAWAATSAGSRRRTGRRCFWTRSASCRWRCRSNSCACCRTGRSSVWAVLQPIKVDVRIIAATNRDLEQAVRDKAFREDLFYRLNVFPITIPPLRERTDDIPALVWAFIDELSRTFGKQIDAISSRSLAELQRYSMARKRPRAAQSDRARDDPGPWRNIDADGSAAIKPAAVGDRSGAAHRRSNRTHQVGARELRLAHSRRERRRTPTRHQTDHPGEPDGEAGDLTRNSSLSPAAAAVSSVRRGAF